MKDVDDDAIKDDFMITLSFVKAVAFSSYTTVHGFSSYSGNA